MAINSLPKKSQSFTKLSKFSKADLGTLIFAECLYDYRDGRIKKPACQIDLYKFSCKSRKNRLLKLAFGILAIGIYLEYGICFLAFGFCLIVTLLKRRINAEALKIVTLHAQHWEWANGVFGRAWAEKDKDPSASFAKIIHTDEDLIFFPEEVRETAALIKSDGTPSE